MFANHMFIELLTRPVASEMYQFSEHLFRLQNNASDLRTTTSELKDMSQIAKVLQEKLSNSNMARVARETGITKTTLHEWTNGVRQPNLKNIQQLKSLSDYLGISLEELLVGSEGSQLVSSIQFSDAGRSYRINIERIK